MRKKIYLSDIAKQFENCEVASIAKMQRTYCIGFAFAASIVNYLEEKGVVSRPIPTRPVIDHEKLKALVAVDDHVFITSKSAGSADGAKGK